MKYVTRKKTRAGGPILPPVVFDFAAGGFLEILEAPVVFAAGGPEILYLTLLVTHGRVNRATVVTFSIALYQHILTMW